MQYAQINTENKEDLLYQIQHRTFASLLEEQEQAIIQAAQQADVRVFTVTVSPYTINRSLRNIATTTGGKWFEDVVTVPCTLSTGLQNIMGSITHVYK